jgi:hypothetical protein
MSDKARHYGNSRGKLAIAMRGVKDARFRGGLNGRFGFRITEKT